MRMTTLFSPPAAGFDEPFAMLHACHERVERSLVLLERLIAHLPQHGADAQAQDAARDVLRYFDLAAPHHHVDEERHVLPALRAQGLAALADRIAADHAAMSAAWCALRPRLAAVVQGDAAPALAAVQEIPRLAALYREHIALEESSAFARAQAALGEAEQRVMGQEMAARRGVVAV
jgi:hemerythrin-like domain-containing protein